jgi:isopenicillin-N epimerase
MTRLDPVPDGAAALRDRWALDPRVIFLNHGSFGACPIPVLADQQAWRTRLESEPVLFLGRELEGHLDAARSALGGFLGADPDDLAFVPNATTGVGTVLRSLRFGPDDEILVTDHEYNAALNAVRFSAGRDGARVVVARIPFPISDPAQVVDAVLGAVTPRTRLAVISHVTSPTALVFPIAGLVAELKERGVDTLVDGAHAPGMLVLDLDAIGAAYYTGNCHKWMCGPKGSAFLHVRRDLQTEIRPLAISHGANARRVDRSRFRLEFDWTGTADPSAFLSLPAAIGFMGSLLPGGWPEVMSANRDLARAGRDLICDALGVAAPAPDGMLGSMAAAPLPDRVKGVPEPGAEAIERALFSTRHIEVPVMAWPVDAVDDVAQVHPAHLVRISAQRYNDLAHYAVLADALRELVG